MTPGGFTGWVLGNRRVYWTQRVDLMAWEISVKRSDGSVVSTLIADVELWQTRLSPIELAQRAFSNPLDRVAVAIIAHREAANDHAIRSFLGAAFHPRRRGKGTGSWPSPRIAPPLSQPHNPIPAPTEAPFSALRAAHAERFDEEPSTKPEPLAPPNPDLPFYRMHR